MKECLICESEKPISEYHRRNDSFDGRRNDCKECRKNNILGENILNTKSYLFQYESFIETPPSLSEGVSSQLFFGLELINRQILLCVLCLIC